MERYQKAIGAFLGALVPILAGLIPGIGDFLTADVRAALSVLLATVLAWALPNKVDGENALTRAERDRLRAIRESGAKVGTIEGLND